MFREIFRRGAWGALLGVPLLAGVAQAQTVREAAGLLVVRRR